MIAYIYVNQQRIRDRSGPPIAVETSEGTRHAYSVTIDGPSKVVSNPNCPLPSGASVWITCKAEDITIDP